MSLRCCSCWLLGAAMFIACGRIGYHRHVGGDASAADAISADDGAQDARAADLASDLARDLASESVGDLARDLASDPVGDLASDPVGDLALDLAREAPSNDVQARDLGSEGGGGDCVAGTLCSLREPFDQSPLDETFFAYSDGSCTNEVVGGSFRISTTGVAGRYCGLVSLVSFVPRGTLTIDAAALPARVSGYVVYLELRDASSHGVELQLSLGSLNLNLKDASGVTKLGAVTYDATLHRYWRFRADGTNVWYETSADASAWMTLLTIASPFVGDVTVNFGAGSVIAGPGATAALPGLNAP